MTTVAIVGAGTMGTTHAQAYATIAGVKVVAVVDADLERAARVASASGAEAYHDLEALLVADHVDIIDCCLPTAYHRAVVERAAMGGIAVICEKPLALSVVDGEAMLAATKAAGVRLLVAQVVRFFPEYRRLQAALRDGAVGTPVSLTLLRQSSYPAGAGTWYRDDALSGGIFLDLMIHDFDWALLQLGGAERVYARLVRRGGSTPFAQGMATIRHTSGAMSLITGTWGYEGPFTTMVEIAGTGGLLRHHSQESTPVRAYTSRAADEGQDVALPNLEVGENAYRAELQHFVNVLRGVEESHVRPEEALAALKLAIAARASAQTNLAQLVGGAAS